MTVQKTMAAFAALSAAAIIVAPMQADASTSFTDVSATYEHAEAITMLQKAGIVSGYPTGEYKPYEAVTRGQAAKMLATALQLQATTDEAAFSDVATSEYKQAIGALHAQGIVSGFADGTFRPEAPITRAQMAKMLAKALDLTATATHPFTDLHPASGYHQAVAALYEHGITKGTTATTFAPTAHVTRGQLAAFLYRALQQSLTNVSILHMNDLHAHVEKYPKLVSAVNEHKAQNPQALVLNAGDAFSGTLYFNRFEGAADIQFLNLMGIDAMTFGNHEFDLGLSENGHQSLVNFIQAAQFPFVSANVDFSKDSRFDGLYNDVYSTEPVNGKVYPGIVKDVDGEQIAIFGLTTEETASIAFVGSVAFKNYITEAKKAVAAFEQMGIDKIVALTHIGFDDNPTVDNDMMLARYVEGIDVIVGGHTHAKLDEPFVVDEQMVPGKAAPTIIVQAYQYADYLGTVDVQFNEAGEVVFYNGQLVALENYEEDAAALALLAPLKEQVEALSNEKIGVTLTQTLPNPRVSDANYAGGSVRNSETVLGNIVTDGMLAKARTMTTKPVVLALQNGGGIRKELPAGDVTIGQIISVLPFANTLALMDVTGKELKEALEVSVRAIPGESGGFLHIAGGKYAYDSSLPAGERIVEVSYFDEASGTYVAIDDETMYTIATNAFSAKGGDSLDSFGRAYAAGRVTDLGLVDWENLRDYLQAAHTIRYETEGRITDLRYAQSAIAN